MHNLWKTFTKKIFMWINNGGKKSAFFIVYMRFSKIVCHFLWWYIPPIVPVYMCILCIYWLCNNIIRKTVCPHCCFIEIVYHVLLVLVLNWRLNWFTWHGMTADWNKLSALIIAKGKNVRMHIFCYFKLFYFNEKKT